jgi:RIO kinase 1
MRNLKRLQAKNIPSPVPITLRENILVMSFIGKNGFPAPCLKDAPLSDDKLHKCYVECVKTMRDMYHKCRLVHADLSEYNILYHKGKIWIIDVSQAVEYDHPQAMDFLRKDCNCISSFFSRKGLDICMNPRELFDFITDIQLEDENVDKYLAKMEEVMEKKQEEEQDPEEEIKEGVFQQSFIPRTLHQVQNPVAEVFEEQPSFHHSVTGLSQKSEQLLMDDWVVINE